MKRGPVVIGYDGSSTSRQALEWGLEDARRRSLPVVVVHAFMPPLPPVPVAPGWTGPDEAALRKGAEATLREAVDHAARTAPDVDVSSRLVSAPPAVALLEGVDAAEMVVVGSRGLDGFTGLLAGSTSVQVAHHADCPVVVIPPQADHAPVGPEAGRVVVGVDGSPVSEDALAFAFDEAALRGVGVTALHAWDLGPFWEQERGKGGTVDVEAVLPEAGEAEHAVLGEALAGWRDKYPDIDVRSVVVHHKPAAALIHASSGAELLVVGSRGRGGFASLVLGSVSHACLHHARCPVAIVRPH